MHSRERRKVAHIVPAKLARDDQHATRFRSGFGDGVVDRHLFELRPDPTHDVVPLRGIPRPGNLAHLRGKFRPL